MLSDYEMHAALQRAYDDWKNSGRPMATLEEFDREAIARAAYERGKEDAAEPAMDSVNKAAAAALGMVKGGMSVAAALGWFDAAILSASSEGAKVVVSPDHAPTRPETEAAIRAAWNHFGSVESITGKLFGETL